jgi:hypothetical protein
LEQVGRTKTELEKQRLEADRNSWFDPPAAIRRLTWKMGSVGAIAWDVIRGYRYQVPRFMDNSNDS